MGEDGGETEHGVLNQKEVKETENERQPKIWMITEFQDWLSYHDENCPETSEGISGYGYEEECGGIEYKDRKPEM